MKSTQGDFLVNGASLWNTEECQGIWQPSGRGQELDEKSWKSVKCPGESLLRKIVYC